MSTRAQRRAAKRNAQLSTGPRTVEGKAVSSRNAVRHNLSGSTFVLLPSEDPAAFDALAREYRREWTPRTEHETFLVTQMVQARWRLNRIARMEALVIDAMFERFGEGRPDEGAIVIGENMNPDPMRRLHRYAQDAERSYNRAVRELRAYRKEQAATPCVDRRLPEIQNEPKQPGEPPPPNAEPPLAGRDSSPVPGTSAWAPIHRTPPSVTIGSLSM